MSRLTDEQWLKENIGSLVYDDRPSEVEELYPYIAQPKPVQFAGWQVIVFLLVIGVLSINLSVSMLRG